jgi:hypothetical protein
LIQVGVGEETTADRISKSPLLVTVFAVAGCDATADNH